MLKSSRRTESIAELDRIHAGYDAADVLKGISLALPAGTITALAGPNGAGKSTLIRVLTGTLTPRSGTIRCDKSQTSLVPQEIALYPWLTPRENCIAFAMMDGLSRRAAIARAVTALEMTGCNDVAESRVSQLSGGYRRRANIAVALMSAPQLMILDEPTAGLDADAKRIVQDVMLRIRDTGCTILVVTHDFDIVEYIADRVLVLSSGQILRDDSPDDLVASICDGRSPVEFLLEAAPDEAQAAFLADRRAVNYGRLRWAVLEERGATDVGPLTTAIEQTGLRVVEMRMRKPNLADAYTFLMRSADASCEGLTP